MQFPAETELYAAIPLRHSVRHYLPTPVPEVVLDCLQTEVDAINSRTGCSFRVVTNEPKSFKNIFAYGKFENVVNYIIISAPKGDDYTHVCGYEGERLVLGLQAMGLNTCWVGLSYSKRTPDFDMSEGHKIRCVISFGYGRTQGCARKSKAMDKLAEINAGTPEWFLRGMEAVMLAPTAINQQKFHFALAADGTVQAKPLFSLVGYTVIDLGIAVCHFALACPMHEINVK